MEEKKVEKKNKSPWLKTLVLIITAIVCFLSVSLIGWYRFGREAADPIQKVKDHKSPVSGKSIADGVLDFAEENGVDISQDGFKPSWGAEEISQDVWVVSFVFEVVRNATWISWEVNMRSGKVRPKDKLAHELWYGD